MLCNNNSIVAIYNNFFNDAFFLKTMGTYQQLFAQVILKMKIGSNGVCPSFCSTGPKFPSPKVSTIIPLHHLQWQPYGVNFPGAVFKFTYSELDGTKRVTEGDQHLQLKVNVL